MALIKVQRLSYCINCENLLPVKCAKCRAHPDRKPRHIVVYDCPPILETGPCGCVKIACQREGCGKSKWTTVPKARSFLRQFCSRACANVVIAEGQKTRSRIACACGCGRWVERPPCKLKTHKRSFFSRLCQARWVSANRRRHGHACGRCGGRWSCSKECSLAEIKSPGVCMACFKAAASSVPASVVRRYANDSLAS